MVSSVSQQKEIPWYEEKEWIDKIRNPIKITVQEGYELYYGQGRASIGTFSRKAKGKENKCPRILLKRYFNKYIGRPCFVAEGKVTIDDGKFCKNRDAIIILV